jgi:hypothetical protein
MARKLIKFVILFDNTNLLYFPGQFLSGRVLVELEEDTPALGELTILLFRRCPLGCLYVDEYQQRADPHTLRLPFTFDANSENQPGTKFG